jgi:hypothetical protein
MRVHLVIERVDVVRPHAKRSLMVEKIAPELRAAGDDIERCCLAA